MSNISIALALQGLNAELSKNSNQGSTHLLNGKDFLSQVNSEQMTDSHLGSHLDDHLKNNLEGHIESDLEGHLERGSTNTKDSFEPLNIEPQNADEVVQDMNMLRKTFSSEAKGQSYNAQGIRITEKHMMTSLASGELAYSYKSPVDTLLLDNSKNIQELASLEERNIIKNERVVKQDTKVQLNNINLLLMKNNLSLDLKKNELNGKIKSTMNTSTYRSFMIKEKNIIQTYNGQSVSLWIRDFTDRDASIDIVLKQYLGDVELLNTYKQVAYNGKIVWRK